MIATLVEGKQLIQTVVASMVAGVGVTFVFSVAIWGAGRFIDLSREDRRVAAGAHAAVSGLALLAVGGAMAFGIIVMTSK